MAPIVLSTQTMEPITLTFMLTCYLGFAAYAVAHAVALVVNCRADAERKAREAVAFERSFRTWRTYNVSQIRTLREAIVLPVHPKHFCLPAAPIVARHEAATVPCAPAPMAVSISHIRKVG